jgi:hypothetical protein
MPNVSWHKMRSLVGTRSSSCWSSSGNSVSIFGCVPCLVVPFVGHSKGIPTSVDYCNNGCKEYAGPNRMQGKLNVMIGEMFLSHVEVSK